MPARPRHLWTLLLAVVLSGPVACAGDQDRTRLQSGDPPNDANPPSAGGAVAELRQQLNSDDAVLRSAAAGRLIEMKTEEARQAVQEVLMTGKEPAILDILKVVGSTRDPRLLPMVVQRLRGTTDAVVDATLACLECFDREKVAEEVSTTLARKDLGVSETSHLVEALGRTRTRGAMPRLIDLYPVADAVVHERVVAALFLVTGRRLATQAEWQAWWDKNKARSREDWEEEALKSENGDPESDVGLELARTKIDLLTMRLSQIPEDKGPERLAVVREAIEYKYCPQVRVFGAGEAAKLPAKERLQTLAPLLVIAQRDSSEEARAAAMEAAGTICADASQVTEAQRSAATVLGTAATGDPAARVRIAAVRGLARLHPSLAVERIRPALADKDLTVQVAAVEALGKMTCAPATRELCDLLPKTEGKPELRKAVVDAMGEIGAPETVPLLVGLLDSSQGDDARPLRWSIANSLGKAHSRDGLGALQRLADDKFLDVRVKAIQGLGAVGGAAQSQTLSAVLRQPTRDPKERSAAAVALGQIGDPSALTDLLAALSDDTLAGDAWKAVVLLIGADRSRAVDVAGRLAERKDWARAIEVLDPVVKDADLEKTAPAVSADARDRLGVALLGAGNRAEALPYLKESSERQGSGADTKLRYVQALTDLKRPAEARAEVERMVAQETAGSELSWSLRARRVALLLDEEKPKEALAEAERLLQEAALPSALRDEVKRLQATATKALSSTVSPENAVRARVQALVADLGGGDEAKRAAALDELQKLGRKAIPELLAEAGGDDASRWGASAKALGEITKVVRALDAKSAPEERQRALAEWRAWFEQK